MKNIVHMEFKSEMLENLEAYSVLLGKDKTQIIEEALQRYFAEAEQQLAEDKERSLTTFSYDEFWDGFEIEEE